jgi:BirA family transcriptional regulator, biotin operon repressor / biotin---[acetyl-CoA-carboxylase] ligase
MSATSPSAAALAAAAAGAAKCRVRRVHLPAVDSTNSYAKTNAATFDRDALTVVTTDEQTAGRGRLGRGWVSARSGQDVTATFAFRVPPSSLPSAYQLSPLLAVTACRALGRHGVEAGIKWPNDIILGGARKTGGILAELESVLRGGDEDEGGEEVRRGPEYWAAVGLGLNVNSEPASLGVDRPVWPLTTLRAEAGGRSYDVAAVTASLVDEMASALPVFFAHGFAPFQAEYERRSVLLGRRVKFTDGPGAVVVGRAVSIGDDGRLYIRVEGGQAAAGGEGGGGGGEGGSGAPEAEVRGFLSGEVSGIAIVEGVEEMVEGHPDGRG